MADAVYWDASAVLSALFTDANSNEAVAQANAPATHLLSTLGYAEVTAVISRLERDQSLPPVLAESARETLARGPWRRLVLNPDWDEVDVLSRRWPLRGADLWHLSTAVTLRRELPDLALLTYDNRLKVAAAAVGLDA